MIEAEPPLSLLQPLQSIARRSWKTAMPAKVPVVGAVMLVSACAFELSVPIGLDAVLLVSTIAQPEHTLPLSEDNPDACPPLNNLRHKLCKLAGRPVNLQATAGMVQFVRDVLFDQPYYTIIQKSDENGRETSAA